VDHHARGGEGARPAPATPRTKHGLAATALPLACAIFVLLAARHRQHMQRRDVVIYRRARRVHRHDIQLPGAHNHHEPRDVIAPANGQPGHTRDLRAVDLEGLIGV
jgi:hypothetical protein